MSVLMKVCRIEPTFKAYIYRFVALDASQAQAIREHRFDAVRELCQNLTYDMIEFLCDESVSIDYLNYSEQREQQRFPSYKQWLRKEQQVHVLEFTSEEIPF